MVFLIVLFMRIKDFTTRATHREVSQSVGIICIIVFSGEGNTDDITSALEGIIGGKAPNHCRIYCWASYPRCLFLWIGFCCIRFTRAGHIMVIILMFLHRLLINLNVGRACVFTFSLINLHGFFKSYDDLKMINIAVIWTKWECT